MAGYNSKFTGQQVDSLLEKAGSSYQKPKTGIPQSDLDESTQQILQNVENKVNKEEGKGLSTNDFTDEYKAKVDDSASQEGYFPKMSVGIAANLAGRGEATEQVFTYRPTDGGTSIESGVAKIRRVKGNSVVWNQLVAENSLTSNGVTSTSNNGVITLSGTPTTTWFNAIRGIPVVLGHKMLLQLFVVANPNNINVNFGDLNNNALISSLTGGGTIYEVSEQTTHYLAFHDSNLTNIDFTGYQMCVMYTDLTAMFGVDDEPTTVEEFRELYPDSYYAYNAGELRNLNCYGIKTVGFNEFNGTYARVLPNKTYYLGGEYTSIAFATELGGTTETISLPSDRLYIPTQLGYIYASGANININLHHTGWRDGNYEPYKEVTHTLPLSQITNGEPLRKARNAYDEINEAEYIKRVGVVDLGSLRYRKSDNYPNLFISNSFGAAGADADKIANLFCSKYIAMTARAPWSDIISMGMDTSNQLYIYDPQYTDIEVFKSAMSGVLLNYELAEPIVTPIETSLNLDYQAEDFGTEEALLAEDSAPFSADIVYQFNAVDRIRENSLDIEDLLARVIALENAAATTTSIPDITE